MTIEEKKLEGLPAPQLARKAGYITLKEASELFGYSPDYIGQLIRKGKIEGKQVYANVAWMTTKSTLDEYLARERGAASSQEKTLLTMRFMRLLASDEASRIAMWALRALIPLLIIVAALVFYFISISIDRKLTRDAERRLDARTAAVVIAPEISGTYFSYEK